MSKRNRKDCKVVWIPMPQVKEDKVIECEISQSVMVLSHSKFFLLFIETPEVCSLSLSCICPIASLVAEKAEGERRENKGSENWIKEPDG